MKKNLFFLLLLFGVTLSSCEKPNENGGSNPETTGFIAPKLLNEVLTEATTAAGKTYKQEFYDAFKAGMEKRGWYLAWDESDYYSWRCYYCQTKQAASTLSKFMKEGRNSCKDGAYVYYSEDLEQMASVGPVVDFYLKKEYGPYCGASVYMLMDKTKTSVKDTFCTWSNWSYNYHAPSSYEAFATTNTAEETWIQLVNSGVWYQYNYPPYKCNDADSTKSLVEGGPCGAFESESETDSSPRRIRQMPTEAPGYRFDNDYKSYKNRSFISSVNFANSACDEYGDFSKSSTISETYCLLFSQYYIYQNKKVTKTNYSFVCYGYEYYCTK